ncbi:hypothetical protein MKW98_007057 [Papaver atlanticum]|uniref:Uncharacterized protein n=1 Tax=Papaver atlanticum TaxID=357466 RepID=A0AAD4SUX7_9MAGN|nr:hypothetical protein MKW98_007057 [Papaver atlanticum]
MKSSSGRSIEVFLAEDNEVFILSRIPRSIEQALKWNKKKRRNFSTSEQSTTGTDVGHWIAFTEPRMQVPSMRSENASRKRPVKVWHILMLQRSATSPLTPDPVKVQDLSINRINVTEYIIKQRSPSWNQQILISTMYMYRVSAYEVCIIGKQIWSLRC